MSNCMRLKWNRKQRGLSQKKLAKEVDLSVGTIGRLEVDETAWLTLRRETEDKLCAFFDQEGMWPLKRLSEAEPEEMNNETEIVEEVTAEIVESETEVVIHKTRKNGLTEKDQKTLDLIEFAYEGLIESISHEDFMANLKMIRRIIDKY